jgi:DMSO/TMAO reductase YedYZ molybdopterin-dependent catalytic subunit
MIDSGFSISISGEVERPGSLEEVELRSLANAELVADFHWREGWSRLGVHWWGVRLATLHEIAGASEAGRYVTVGSGDYTVVLTRKQAADDPVLLALERDGGELGRSDGFPRLVGPSEWDCFQSVKSVDRIELTSEPEQATAATIALARIDR